MRMLIAPSDIIQMPKLSKFKVVLVGDQNVGKTSIISRFIHDSFELAANPTVGIDFVTKTMQVDGETLRLQLWDTAGQERFRALIPSYVKDADTCLIVLDLSLRASFDNLDRWLDFVRDSRGPDASIFIVGNKSDVSDREVAKKDVEQYAQQHRYPYLEVSAKTGTNVPNLFRKIAQKLIEGKQAKQHEREPQKKQKSASKSEEGGVSLTKKEVTQAKQTCQC